MKKGQEKPPTIRAGNDQIDIELLKKQSVPPPSIDNPVEDPVGLAMGKSNNNQQPPTPPINNENLTPIPEPNNHDKAIEDQLKLLQFPTQIIIRPSYDYRKEYHILNILEAEFIEIVKYKPSDAFFGNLALDIFEMLHNYCPEFRDKLNSISTIITKIPKAEDKQNYIKDFMLKVFNDLIKDEYKGTKKF